MQELSDYCETHDTVFVEVYFAHIINCFETNMFKPLSRAAYQVNPEDLMQQQEFGVRAFSNNAFLEPGWQYLELIYNLFSKFLVKMKGGSQLMELLDEKFVRQLIERVNSPDIREREKLKKIGFNCWAVGKSLNGPPGMPGVF